MNNNRGKKMNSKMKWFLIIGLSVIVIRMAIIKHESFNNNAVLTSADTN